MHSVNKTDIMKNRHTRKKIIALIPCYNEAGGIKEVIESFPIDKIKSHGFNLEIIVIDNNSTDRTAEIARSLGAAVIHEPKKGKGNAMRTGFDAAIKSGADYIVMLDGDNTYRPEEILRLIEPLDSDFATVVIGSRLGGKILEGSMTAFNRLGNWAYSHLVRHFYRVNMTDVLTGYFAWKREALERLRPYIQSEGFAIEMEMVTKMARLGEDITCVPISYHPRAGVTNLRPIYDGTRILWMFTKNLRWTPQMQINPKLLKQKSSQKKIGATEAEAKNA
jgi:dolichol-phosphate mannosyltransferase